MKKIKVKVSNVKNVLPKDVVAKVSRILESQSYGMCYETAAYVGLALKGMGYDVKVCYGLFDSINTRKEPHSFNRLDINGKTYYVDFQFEVVNKTSLKDMYLIEERDVDDVVEIFNREGNSFCPFVGFANFNNYQYVYYDGNTRHSIPFEQFDWESYSHLDKYGFPHFEGQFTERKYYKTA